MELGILFCGIHYFKRIDTTELIREITVWQYSASTTLDSDRLRIYIYIYICTWKYYVKISTYRLNMYTHILVGGFNYFLLSIIYGIILPIDFHIFQDGWNHQHIYIYIYMYIHKYIYIYIYIYCRKPNNETYHLGIAHCTQTQHGEFPEIVFTTLITSINHHTTSLTMYHWFSINFGAKMDNSLSKSKKCEYHIRIPNY